MAYLPVDLMTSDLHRVRRLKVSSDDQKSAYGESLTASKSPITQINAKYGITTEVLTAALGGTTSVVDNMYVASTGTGANNVAAVISAREAAQRPGQGLVADISAVLTQGQPNSTQQVGLISSESAIGFGFNGDSFGIVVARDGDLENQDLTITAAPAAPESASITVDGVLYSVPITNVTVNQVAYQIATYLNANEPRYRFSSNGGVVTALARLPDFGSGAFSFTSATATGSWLEVKPGTIPTEVWIPYGQFNQPSSLKQEDSKIDPTKYNEYRIQIDANVMFYIKDPLTGEYELVHVYQHLNDSDQSLIDNPTFRVGWACRNTGNTTDIQVKGFFAASFVEGDISYNQLPFSASNIQAGVGLDETNVISFRNRSVYQDTANRAEIIPKLVSVGTDSTKPVLFEVIANPVTSSFLDWEYLNEEFSLMEVAYNSVPITGGNVIGTFVVDGSRDIDIADIVNYHIPTAEYSITARITSGNASSMTVSGTWQEDK